MVQHFLGTLKLPMAIYMLDYYLPMLSPNDGYNETGLTMQSAGPVGRNGNPFTCHTYIKEASSVTGKSQGGTMPLPSDIPASPRQTYANCWTVKLTTTKSALLGQEDSSHWLGCPVPKMQLQARFLLCLG